MGDIKKSIELYELIIKRLEASGNAPNQLAAYKGSLDCFKDCATDDEAMAKLAASPWYTAVAQGLVLDDLEAKMRAVKEMGMDDVAAAYEAKLAEVRQDYLKAWDTSYTGNIQQLYAAHYNKRETELRERYEKIEAEINKISGEKDEPSTMEDIVGARLKGLFGGKKAAAKPVAAKPAAATGMPDMAAVTNLPDLGELEAEADAAWEAVKAMKETAIAVGREELAELSRGEAVCIAPADASGKYSFEQLRKEAF